jgi:ankyrin repeat protein
LVERSEDLGTNIIDSIGNAGWNALHCACYEGNTELAKYYIDKGADVNKNSIDGWTPL